LKKQNLRFGEKIASLGQSQVNAPHFPLAGLSPKPACGFETRYFHAKS
jgi:hypothetical protein